MDTLVNYAEYSSKTIVDSQLLLGTSLNLLTPAKMVL